MKEKLKKNLAFLKDCVCGEENIPVRFQIINGVLFIFVGMALGSTKIVWKVVGITGGLLAIMGLNDEMGKFMEAVLNRTSHK